MPAAYTALIGSRASGLAHRHLLPGAQARATAPAPGGTDDGSAAALVAGTVFRPSINSSPHGLRRLQSWVPSHKHPYETTLESSSLIKRRNLIVKDIYLRKLVLP